MKFDLIGAISEQTCKDVGRYLDLLKDEPGTITINSEGGSTLDAIALYSVISRHKPGITTIAIGSCMSAAVLVFLAGKQRFSYPETWFMVHECASKVKGSVSEINTELKFMRRQDEQFCILLEKHTKTPRHMWDDLSSKTTYLSASEAKDLGLVQKVLK